MSNHLEFAYQRPRASDPRFLRKWALLLHRAFFSAFMQAVFDSVIVVCTLLLAYLARFDGQIPEPLFKQFIAVVPYFLAVYLAAIYIGSVHRLVWRYVGLRDASMILKSVAAAGLVLFSLDLIVFELLGTMRVPLGVVVLHPILVYGGLIGFRLLRRLIYERGKRAAAARVVPGEVKRKTRVVLVGAGRAGVNLVRELVSQDEFEITGFLDDDPQLQRRLVEGFPVFGTTRDVASVVTKQAIEEVVLCMPSASRQVLSRIAAECEEINVRTLSVPSLTELMTGPSSLDRLRPVSTEELLGRESVQYSKDGDELKRVFFGRRILITGAGGSIGSELARQLKDVGPSQLILLDKDENSLYEIDLEVRQSFSRVRDIVADIRDVSRMERVFEEVRPEVVFHAAAYKHVPLMEKHPNEAVLTNVIGTKIVAELCARFGGNTFVMISTDKAVNPTSVMGASKRVGEMVVRDVAKKYPEGNFCCVRFGNVLGSRGSVVPVFQKLISQGRNLPVTHPEIRRYFMTIPEAVQLVIRAGSLGRNGDVFLLDMGKQVKIVDLARNLIRLSGLVPDQDIKIEFTGLRPGEKLFEELLAEGENGVRTTKYSKIMVAKSNGKNGLNLTRIIGDLEVAARGNDHAWIKRILESLGIGYHAPSGSNGFGALASPQRAVQTSQVSAKPF